jgi:hypothetical protein
VGYRDKIEERMISERCVTYGIYTQALIMELKPTSIEGIKWLNGLDVGSRNYKEYFGRKQDIKNANEIKNSKASSKANKQQADYMLKKASCAFERMGINPDVAITLNPSPMPPLET